MEGRYETEENSSFVIAVFTSMPRASITVPAGPGGGIATLVSTPGFVDPLATVYLRTDVFTSFDAPACRGVVAREDAVRTGTAPDTRGHTYRRKT